MSEQPPSGSRRAGAPTRRVQRPDGSGYDWTWGEAPSRPATGPDRGVQTSLMPPRSAPPTHPAPGSRPAPAPAPGYRPAPAPVGDPADPGNPADPADPALPPAAAPRPRRRRHPLRAVLVTLLVLVLLIGGGIAALGGYAWSKVGRTDALPSSGATADTPGTNYLLVGSDSRAGLTPEQVRALHTGSSASIGGQRTDTILLLHDPAGGGAPTLVSIPRDSYVAIPGHSRNKINAAYAIGGAPLLIRTVEQATGVHIDRYVEVGLGGFAAIVDEVGGVRLCLDTPLDDAKAHVNLPKGCQVLNGAQALGFVRARYTVQGGDLGRVDHQRQFVSALLSRVASAGTLLNPGRVWNLASDGGSALTVDAGMHWWQAVSLVRAARAATADGNSITVPTDGSVTRPVGDVLIWNPTLAAQLWKALRTDQPVPAAVTRTGR